jgi:hypothetical protein
MLDTLDVPYEQGKNAATSGFQDYLIAELRCASLRARILQSEIDAIGVALKGGLISADQALVLMNGVDLLRYIGAPTDDA